MPKPKKPWDLVVIDWGLTIIGLCTLVALYTGHIQL